MHVPVISLPTESQIEAIDAALARAAKWAGVDRSPDAEKVQEIYDAFLEQSISDSDRIITLGIAFGQVLVDCGGLEWVQIKDQYGEEVCVAVKDKECFCAPISMMEKRINRAESLSIARLCAETLELLDAQSQKVGVRARLRS